jgi:beta-lactamase regulating signal transducer with metallopeptidase domain
VNTAHAAHCNDADIPAVHANCEGLFAVAGVVTPRLFVSHDVRALLNKNEFKCAMAHEMVHVNQRDNLAKLLVNLCGAPGMTTLRREWQQALEMRADHYAVRTRAEALELASALVKMSRLRLHRLPELATGFAAAETAPLSARVERLLAWNDAPERPSQALRFTTALLCATGVVIAGISYQAILLQVHVFTEWLVR